jgi:hydrogenase expression/formation protein HypC
MQIIEIDGVSARCTAGGIERDINLFLLQGDPAVVGDFVMVHVGYAIQKIAPESARSSWHLHDQMRAGSTEMPDPERADDA